MFSKHKKKNKDVYKQNNSFEELFEIGKKHLESGKPRDAIEFFKLALKSGGNIDELKPFLFKAYLLRENQLRQKGLVTEAAAVKKIAYSYMPKIEQLSEKDLISYISTCDIKDAFESYVRYKKIHGYCAKIEQILANHCFKSNYWSFINLYDDLELLKKDSSFIQKAITFMNDAKWEQALDEIRIIESSSPYASIRIFCQGMVSFYADDNKKTLRAFGMIPENFPLYYAAKSISDYLSNKFNINIPKCMFKGEINLEQDAEILFNNMETRDFRRAGEDILRLSKNIYPDNPVQAALDLLKIISNLLVMDKITMADLNKIAKNILPPKILETFLAKIDFNFCLPQSHFNSINKLISILENEFPDKNQRNIAHALVLSTAVANYRQRGMDFFIYEDISKYKKLLGIKSNINSHEMILIEMMKESIRLDPDNKASYQILASLHRGASDEKNAVEEVFLNMLKLFPEDPYPCLELSNIYYEKHAFRKVEKILEEAMKRAPHDNKVIEKYAISLLYSAQKNIYKNNMELVRKDIGKVVKLDIKKIAIYLNEKQIIFDIYLNDGKNITQIIHDKIHKLSVFERLRLLTVLIADIRYNIRKFNPEVKSLIEKFFRDELNEMKKLSSAEIIKLLSPLEKDIESLMQFRDVYQIFSSNWKDIFKIVNNSDVIIIFDYLMESRSIKLIQDEIKVRLKNANKLEHNIMNFYLSIITQIESDKLNGNGLRGIVSKTDNITLEKLRVISRQLSKYAKGSFRFALEKFDFEKYDKKPTFPSSDFFDDYEDDYDDDDDFDDFGDMLGDGPPPFFANALISFFEEINLGKYALSGNIPSDVVQDMVNKVEKLIDNLKIRGMPNMMLKGFSQIFKMEPNIMQFCDILKKHIKGIKISREAKLIIMGK